jgi:hypothetical protein
MDLTIIIPTYNRNNHVVECVFALEHSDADIIVVDDGSERPVAVPATSGRVIRHDTHRGRAAAINTGLRAAAHNLVLIVDDDLYAGPDMVERMVDEFFIQRNSRLALTARVVWDPDLPLTLTMRWLQQTGKFRAPILFWRPFVLEHGGYDENLIDSLEDVEFQLRYKDHGLEVRQLESAVGYQTRVTKIRNLIEREFMEGVSSVYLHSKFPKFLPVIDDMEALLRNEKQICDAEAAVEEICLLDQAEASCIPDGACDLFVHVCRYFFLHGIFEGLRDIGGLKPRKGDSSTLALYNHASHLEALGELDEARRLFRLVLQRPDQGYWEGAEYHLGCIEIKLGSEAAAHAHFLECLRRNPGHDKARRALNKTTLYREVQPNIFEIIEPAAEKKALIVVFGELGNIVNTFPVVEALREKFPGGTVWLTSPEYAALARASAADAVREAEPRGIIPWEWIHAQGFTHVFYPEPGANVDEWQRSAVHPIDFMAQKCSVRIGGHQSRLEPQRDAIAEAEDFLTRHGLTRNGFVTASHVSDAGRHWSHSNLTKLVQNTDMPTIVFSRRSDPEIPGAIPCFEKPCEVIAALIAWSCFYVGSDSGISWLATTTETPMAVFVDPVRANQLNVGFRDVLQREKINIQEWSIHTGLEAVLEHLRGKILIPQTL